MHAMTSNTSVYNAVQHYRICVKTGSTLLPCSSENWWRSIYWIADLIARDKIIRLITNPDQMCMIFVAFPK